MLGVPIGCQEFVKEELLSKVTSLSKASPDIAQYPDPQQAATLLRLCYANKLNYHLRTIDCNITQTAAIHHDTNVEVCFRGIVGHNHELTREEWLQVILDTKDGGFGVPSAAKTRWAAYLASGLGCLKNMRALAAHFGLQMDLQHLDTSPTPLVRNLRQCHQRISDMLIVTGMVFPSLQELAANTKALQHKITEKLSRHLKHNLLTHLDTKGRMRLESCAREGGGWLACVAKTPDQRLTPEQFRIQVFKRLGKDLPQLTRMPCICKHGTIDTKGFHLCSQCPVGNQRFQTHDAIALTWVALLKQAGFMCRVEDPGCFRELQDTNKRADIVVDNWEDGKRAIFDISVTHPWTQESLRVAGRSDGYVEQAASLREKQKVNKYERSCPNNTVFIPLVFETYGRWGAQARPVFKKCIDRVVANKAAPKAVVTAYWRQRFSVVLQRYTASCILERIRRVVVREPATCGDESNRLDYRVLGHCR
ncbi:MAG: hypothetical protein ACK4ZJ_15140 [Allorhizobium sp.]